MAGGLVSTAKGNDVTSIYHTGDACTKGDLFLAIDPVALGSEAFVERTNTFLVL